MRDSAAGITHELPLIGVDGAGVVEEEISAAGANSVCVALRMG